MQDMKYLEQKANEIRIHAVKMIGKAKSGHPGGSLSSADLLAALYFDVMNVDPKNPKWEDRDRFVMSKGHCCPALYAALALKGFFGMEHLETLRELGSILQGHPCSGKTPGVDVTTGSLGQGLSVANGIAIGGRLDQKDYYVYCLMGDGEIQEGQVWEAVMSSACYKLDHVIAFLDYNHLQIDGRIEDVIGLVDIPEKFAAFGWHVLRVNGHRIDEILAAIAEAKATKGKPSIVIMDTIKGKGVSFMENQASWHGSPPNAEQLAQALKELEGSK